MGKLEICIANHIYTVKRKYPAIKEFGKRVHEIERELNNKGTTDCSSGECRRKPMCKNGCKNRQMH